MTHKGYLSPLAIAKTIRLVYSDHIRTLRLLFPEPIAVFGADEVDSMEQSMLMQMIGITSRGSVLRFLNFARVCHMIQMVTYKRFMQAANTCSAVIELGLYMVSIAKLIYRYNHVYCTTLETIDETTAVL